MSNTDLLKKYLSKQKGFDERLIAQTCESFLRNPDILDELNYYLVNNAFRQNPIEERGYTAQLLHELYGESLKRVFDAYNFLIFIREDPDYAIKIINKRFPKK